MAEKTSISFPRSNQGLSILVVDHDTTSLMWLASMLEDFAFKVTTIELATIALHMVRSQEGRFELVMANIDMLDMDRFDFLRFIAEKNIPIVFMSKKRSIHVAQDALAGGALLFLHKPISANDLQFVCQYVHLMKRRSACGIEGPSLEGKTNNGTRKPQGVMVSEEYAGCPSEVAIFSNDMPYDVGGKYQTITGRDPRGKGKNIEVEGQCRVNGEEPWISPTICSSRFVVNNTQHGRSSRCKTIGDCDPEGRGKVVGAQGHRINSDEPWMTNATRSSRFAQAIDMQYGISSSKHQFFAPRDPIGKGEMICRERLYVDNDEAPMTRARCSSSFAISNDMRGIGSRGRQTFAASDPKAKSTLIYTDEFPMINNDKRWTTQLRNPWKLVEMPTKRPRDGTYETEWERVKRIKAYFELLDLEIHKSNGKQEKRKQANIRKARENKTKEREASSKFEKKAERITWNHQLHQKFINAIISLRDKKARPKAIAELMRVPGLTPRHVGSHMQKYKYDVQHIQEIMQILFGTSEPSDLHGASVPPTLDRTSPMFQFGSSSSGFQTGNQSSGFGTRKSISNLGTTQGKVLTLPSPEYNFWTSDVANPNTSQIMHHSSQFPANIACTNQHLNAVASPNFIPAASVGNGVRFSTNWLNSEVSSDVMPFPNPTLGDVLNTGKIQTDRIGRENTVFGNIPNAVNSQRSNIRGEHPTLGSGPTVGIFQLSNTSTNPTLGESPNVGVFQRRNISTNQELGALGGSDAATSHKTSLVKTPTIFYDDDMELDLDLMELSKLLSREESNATDCTTNSSEASTNLDLLDVLFLPDFGDTNQVSNTVAIPVPSSGNMQVELTKNRRTTALRHEEAGSNVAVSDTSSSSLDQSLPCSEECADDVLKMLVEEQTKLKGPSDPECNLGDTNQDVMAAATFSFRGQAKHIFVSNEFN